VQKMLVSPAVGAMFTHSSECQHATPPSLSTPAEIGDCSKHAMHAELSPLAATLVAGPLGPGLCAVFLALSVFSAPVATKPMRWRLCLTSRDGSESSVCKSSVCVPHVGAASDSFALVPGEER
jgi:hypothetical protein